MRHILFNFCIKRYERWLWAYQDTVSYIPAFGCTSSPSLEWMDRRMGVWLRRAAFVDVYAHDAYLLSDRHKALLECAECVFESDAEKRRGAK